MLVVLSYPVAAILVVVFAMSGRWPNKLFSLKSPLPLSMVIAVALIVLLLIAQLAGASSEVLRITRAGSMFSGCCMFASIAAWRNPAIVFALTGLSFNWLAVVCNGFMMPALGCGEGEVYHRPMDADTRLRWLCDIFPFTDGSQIIGALSVGDMFIAFSLWVLVYQQIFSPSTFAVFAGDDENV